MSSQKFDNILETIGRTPVVRINRLAPEGVNLFVKVEAFNPMDSVKDRLALGVIEDAERSGQLSPSQTVIEATSGNTGIGLAMVCAQKGYPLVVTMAENFSVERRKLMRFFGVKVVLTPASARGTGMLDKAVELAEANGWFLTRQFENEADADVHSRTTAVEILEAFLPEGPDGSDGGERLDYWVTGFGSGGTLKGVARVLKERSPHTKVVVCEPDTSQVLASGIRQTRAADGGLESHSAFHPHPVQGWAPDFIPQLAEDAVDSGYIDQLMPVSGDGAIRLAQELAQKEGIFAGISGGATLEGALKICESAPAGTNVLCMLPDTGERYLTTPLFEDIAVEMTPEEIEISHSTPRYRFDAAPTLAASAAGEASDDADGAAATSASATPEAISDANRPVVMFALEWCEVCWSVRKLFAAAGIAYRSIDIDSVEYQKDDWGGQIHTALTALTSSTTIPQVFVGGKYIGGCTEVMAAHGAGELQQLLQDNSVVFDDENVVAAEFLPSWLHRR